MVFLHILVSSGQKSSEKNVFEIPLKNGKTALIDFYSDNIFRLCIDEPGKGFRNPEASPRADILCENPRRSLTGKVFFEEVAGKITIVSPAITIMVYTDRSVFGVYDKSGTRIVEFSLAQISEKSFSIEFNNDKGEYFYGGGVQNGRFSHLGSVIYIENQNSWTDGGVASPTPFFWSTKGFGMMFHTFKKGKYDFDSEKKGIVKLSHEDSYLDVFIMADKKPRQLISDFYQLTGKPVMIPKFGLYEGHLNAYNRDYWKEDANGILFEDGKKYKESQKNDGGIKESLNGENDNYQFSARAVIDRYCSHDMPLGWILPNDGYGAGYGTAETLDGNIENLKCFGDYAGSRGVELGLWTQSDLFPKKDLPALLQRDIEKEVEKAGVRILKTDVAWVGPGYSFGLNGISSVCKVLKEKGNNSRSFIITLDGWAGTQRYASVWTGDQTGGNWEYIRFHIPTYIGSGLSGQPNICSDMDGIFGGKNPIVNIRDFQWKALTLLQLNMDGWGANEKYPHALGEPATSINRNYLKFKSELLPYTYSVCRTALDGKPAMRAMFWDYPNDYTFGKRTAYQFMLGDNFLVAPIYKETKPDKDGNDVRNGIYLPEGQWIDYFDGTLYEGGKVLNNYKAPIWKLPLFVKNGSIIPLANPSNNISEIRNDLRIFEIYPHKTSSFLLYDDDGKTNEYQDGKELSTLIESFADRDIKILIHPSKGDYSGLNPIKYTELRINLSSSPKKIILRINGKKKKLKKVSSVSELSDNTYCFEQAPELNRFSTKGTPFEKKHITKNPQLRILIEKSDIKETEIKLELKGAEKLSPSRNLFNTGSLQEVNFAMSDKNKVTPYEINLTWEKLKNADYYEAEFENVLYTDIADTNYVFDLLIPKTEYSFKVRGINKDGKGEWKSFTCKTSDDPYEYAIKGIKATSTCESQPGEGIENLTDFDENGSMWHSKYGVSSIPASILLNLNTVNVADKLVYVPRKDAGNGTITSVSVYGSLDGVTYRHLKDAEWTRDGKPKEIVFGENVKLRFIRLDVKSAVGNYISGREIYVFKKPHTQSYLPGDVNMDGKVDNNDLVSYTNYTGLKKGDPDFDGYISNGDINDNGVIDVFDISNAVHSIYYEDCDKSLVPSGNLTLKYRHGMYRKGECMEIYVIGNNLKNVDHVGFSIPYEISKLEFAGITALKNNYFENITNNRVHKNGESVLYPTFINISGNPSLQGTEKLFVIKFKVLDNHVPSVKAEDIILLNRNLNIVN